MQNTVAQSRPSSLSPSRYICLACRSSILATRERSIRRNLRTSYTSDGSQLQASARHVTITAHSRTSTNESAVLRPEQSHIKIPSSQRKWQESLHSTQIGAKHRSKQEHGYCIRAAKQSDQRGCSSWAMCSFGMHHAGSSITDMKQILRHVIATRDRRFLHTSAKRGLETHLRQTSDDVPMPHPGKQYTDPAGGIRDRLRQWQIQHRFDPTVPEIEFPQDNPTLDDDMRNLSRLGDNRSSTKISAVETNDVQPDSNSLADLNVDEAADISVSYLRKGDLVLLSTANNEAGGTLAVFVRTHLNKIQLYNSRGQWLHTSNPTVLWSLSGWAPEALVDQLIPYLPTVEEMVSENMALKASQEDVSVPREAGIPLLDMMAAFAQESLELYRKHATALDNAHGLLSHDTDLRYGSLPSVTMHLLQMERSQLTPVALYTVRIALSAATFGFSFDRYSSRSTGLLQIRSKSQIRMIQEVTNWVREWQDEVARRANLPDFSPMKMNGIIPEFLARVIRIVNKSRETREPTKAGNVGPSKLARKLSPEQDSVKTIHGEAFNAQEQKIVSFFECYAFSQLFKRDSKLTSIPSAILKATGLYDGYDLGTMTALVFLQELGVALPYDNHLHYDPHLMLPSSRHSRPLVQFAAKLAAEGRQGFQFTDSMQDLRHDWGSLPVYCIDGADAHEIDDGISIEPDQAGDDCWIRVHIANPTAFLDKNLPIARMARHMGETVYAPDRSHMMLPPSATQNYWSLAPGRPTLTLSARLDRQGNILETDIRPGIVHNVRRLRPQTVDKMLGIVSTSDSNLVLVVGGDVPEQSTSRESTQDPNDQATMHAMNEIAIRLAAKRQANGGVSFDIPKNNVDVWTTWARKGIYYSPLSMQHSRRVEGDPVIRMQVAQHKNYFRSAVSNDASALVQEYMLLASEIAARWCGERQIPTLFRGTRMLKVDMPSREEFWQTVCEPAMRKNNGELPAHVGLKLLQHLGSTCVTTVPLEHNVLGLGCYTKVTSPLRRYGDMIAHWQIEAALKHEAQTGQSLIDTNSRADRSFLPFPRSALETFVIGYQARERSILQMKQRSAAFWECMLVLRAHHFNETELPFQTYRMYISQEPADVAASCNGVMIELNMRAEMYHPRMIPGQSLNTVRFGDTWECQLDVVNMIKMRVMLKPIRLLHRWE